MLQKKYYSAEQIVEACSFIDGKSYLAVMNNLAKMDGAEVIAMGEAYPIDDYILRFVYKEDSTEPTHFVITKFGMPKPLAEDAEE